MNSKYGKRISIISNTIPYKYFDINVEKFNINLTVLLKQVKMTMNVVKMEKFKEEIIQSGSLKKFHLNGFIFQNLNFF